MTGCLKSMTAIGLLTLYAATLATGLKNQAYKADINSLLKMTVKR